MAKVKKKSSRPQRKGAGENQPAKGTPNQSARRPRRQQQAQLAPARGGVEPNVRKSRSEKPVHAIVGATAWSRPRPTTARGGAERPAGLGRIARVSRRTEYGWSSIRRRAVRRRPGQPQLSDPSGWQTGRVAPPAVGELPAGAYDMGREFRILSRLPDALPFVPRGLFLCADAS